MNLKLLHEDVEIHRADEHDWQLYDQAVKIANDSGIRISRNKELSFVAVLGREVVGAVWSAFEPDDELGGDGYRYDFDVVVKHGARSSGLSSRRVGPRLIEAAIKDYESLKSEFPNSYIGVWVVNPKLARYLEDRHGFQTEGGGEWHPSKPFMVYY